MKPLSKPGPFAMPAKSHLLPLYESPEEYMDEAELNSVTLPIPDSQIHTALATVIIDKLDNSPPHYQSPPQYKSLPHYKPPPYYKSPPHYKSLHHYKSSPHSNSPPRLTHSTAPPYHKKHAKFTEVDFKDFRGGKLSFSYKHAYSGNAPNRIAYGSVNLPSTLRPPPRCLYYKMEKQEDICSPWHTSHPEAQKLRSRQSRKDFTDSEFAEYQKLSPLLCLLASLMVMLILFLWFLSGGDIHRHHHKEMTRDDYPD